MSVALAARNLLRALWNRCARMGRRTTHWSRRGAKQVREARKEVRAQVRGAADLSRDAGHHAYADAVRATRYVKRLRQQTVPRLVRDVGVRRQLRRIASGTRPIVVGPWLGEVGYEALYWAPFVRWFADYHRVDSGRMVVVSRGGTASWYADFSTRYVELLDIFTPGEFARLNAERYVQGDQKQSGLAAFDADILARVRAQNGLAEATVLHPSAMFRLLGPFWLGNESLQYALDYLQFRRLVLPASSSLPELPPRFAAAKFYSGRALPDEAPVRDAVRRLLGDVSRAMPVVLLDTGLRLDEHSDLDVAGSGFTSLASALTPQNNLGVQTLAIQRATLFLGTCGGLAWLAPMLGTPTVAMFADDHLLGPHLYAARYAYRQIDAAPFTTLDLNAVAALRGDSAWRVS